ncbi:hypothetical protein Dsin_009046 [Dipteronia sinensis]|uniref:Reverse transcriptase n=1 Tax=Dipteronia sinensis TaxID=43782 RepID=A0AAE0EBD6_9ROSI|nr:hypothetical protein Dsin_009046 [Dipteronia sinensis]
MTHLLWLCIGDFNEILSDDDKTGGLPRNRKLVEDFLEVLDYCSLKDMGFRGPSFTWCNKCDGSNSVQERLDRGFYCIDWRQLFPRASITHLEYWHFGHRAFLLDITSCFNMVDGLGSKRRRWFHFEACWAEKVDCRNLVINNRIKMPILGVFSGWCITFDVALMS